jgi:hypothetical protein
VTVTGPQFLTLLGNMNKYLAGNVNITVSSSTATAITITGFIGPGKLTISMSGSVPATLGTNISFTENQINITLEKVEATGTISIVGCKNLTLNYCTAT